MTTDLGGPGTGEGWVPRQLTTPMKLTESWWLGELTEYGQWAYRVVELWPQPYGPPAPTQGGAE